MPLYMLFPDSAPCVHNPLFLIMAPACKYILRCAYSSAALLFLLFPVIQVKAKSQGRKKPDQGGQGDLSGLLKAFQGAQRHA